MEATLDIYSSFQEKIYRYFNNPLVLHEGLTEDKKIGEEFMDIMENGKISSVYQPIISLKDGGVLGYEALSRGPAGTAMENPMLLFDVARVYGKLWELDFMCRVKALEGMHDEDEGFNIFLNVDPGIISDEKFKRGFTKELLKNFGINPGNIVLEITERNAINDFNNFRRIIDNYKDQGYKIAIDDAGAGYSGLKLITEIHPDFIKLDMNLIRDIDKDGLKYALIKTFYEFCLVTDIKLVAEGIETVNELNALIDIGINYGQGYLIQKPLPEITAVGQNVLDLIAKRNNKKKHLYYNRASSAFIGDICRENFCVTPDCTGASALEIFGKNQAVQGLPVVENNRVVGLVMRDKLYGKLGTQYGFSLFLNRNINLIMDRRPLIVDCETSIDIVSKMAMTRCEQNLYDYVIVTRTGLYHGIVTVKDLLEKTTELEVNYAKHLNPLSGLPGNVIIEHKLKDMIESDSQFTVLYIDIDNFKVYNDVNGFENGDRMIQFLGRIITENTASNCSCGYFIGHIGGDDFIVLIEGYEVEGVCSSIIAAFENGRKEFYTGQDLQKGFVNAKNRRGVEEQFGLVTLSIAGMSNMSRSYKDIYELSEYASKLKIKCKETWHSIFFIE